MFSNVSLELQYERLTIAVGALQMTGFAIQAYSFVILFVPPMGGKK